MPDPAVAVVVPVFNRPRAVIDALDSIAAQTFRDYQLVIVDDGSTDDTAERVRRWLADQGSRINARLIQQSNAGCALARNRGLQEVRGAQLVAFLDSDDLWKPQYLERMSQAMAAAPQAVAVTRNAAHIDAETGRQRVISCDYLTGSATHDIFTRLWPMPTFTVVRAEAYFAEGGFDPFFRLGYEDADLWLRLSLRGPWIHVAQPLVVRRSKISQAIGGTPQMTELVNAPPQCKLEIYVLNRFLHQYGGVKVLTPAVYRKRLAQAHYRLGKSLAREGDFAAAAASFTKALARDPWFLRARRRRLWARWKLATAR